jgi:hypothetical protein
MTARARASVERGQTRHAATEKALRQAWERLRLGVPTHPDLAGADRQLSITTVCLEARCSRNALYDGHPELLHEIQTAIAKQRQAAGQTGRDAKRHGIEADLAACRAERQRLISENAALLLRAITAEEALARMKRRAPVPLEMTDDTPEAS